MKLALGTVQFGLDYGVANDSGRVAIESASLILQKARHARITTLDTAIAYGDSESVLGTIGVASWKIVTKLPAVPGGCSDLYRWVREEVAGSLARLKVKKLYGLLLHRPSELLEDKGRFLHAAMQSLKSEGLVEKIGISVYGPAELNLLFDQYRFDLVQAPLSILDRSMVETGWADRLKLAGVEVHTRSAFLQGLLLMPAHRRPLKFSRWAEIWQEWDRWLIETSLTPLQACLQYATSLDCVDRVVVGVDSVEQLNQIIDAASGALPSLPLFKSLQDERLVNPATWKEL